MVDVTVLLVSLPERHELLVEALTSAHDQTVEPAAILVGVDPYRVGEGENMNRLARAASSEWLAFLHDDDVWFPDHLAELAAHSADADVVVGSFELVGRPTSTIEPHHCNYSDLTFTNWFPPSGVMVRADMFHRVGGFQPPDPNRGERWWDWTLWRHLLAAGARFACSHQVTWQYRFGPWSNGSWQA